MVARMLCLHGFATNAQVMKRQLEVSGLEQRLRQVAELHVIDGPHIVEKHESVPERFEGPFYGWWRAQKLRDSRMEYAGWSETASYLEQYMKENGPFDGVLGFSQGACLAALLVGLQQQRQFLTERQGLKSAIIISGFFSRDSAHQVAYEDVIQCPSLHIMGAQEDLEASRRLTKKFADPIIIEHPGGHIVPRLDDNNGEMLLSFVTEATAASRM